MIHPMKWQALRFAFSALLGSLAGYVAFALVPTKGHQSIADWHQHEGTAATTAAEVSLARPQLTDPLPEKLRLLAESDPQAFFAELQNISPSHISDFSQLIVIAAENLRVDIDSTGILNSIDHMDSRDLAWAAFFRFHASELGVKGLIQLEGEARIASTLVIRQGLIALGQPESVLQELIAANKLWLVSEFAEELFLSSPDTALDTVRSLLSSIPEDGWRANAARNRILREYAVTFPESQSARMVFKHASSASSAELFGSIGSTYLSGSADEKREILDEISTLDGYLGNQLLEGLIGPNDSVHSVGEILEEMTSYEVQKRSVDSWLSKRRKPGAVEELLEMMKNRSGNSRIQSYVEGVANQPEPQEKSENCM
ncbi:MAG: hypothetical protein KDN22_18255 [Verrucomicrobiae bacterium]|nr:hypothetical protein [Verrucomicrobiae bacterium]